MRQIPQRPQNICKTCHYTWYPRGKNISHRCPRCGSTRTEMRYEGLIIAAVLILVFLIILLITI